MPHYNVMGVAKAALEMSVRYLASDLGPQGHPRERRSRPARSRRWPPPAFTACRRCSSTTAPTRRCAATPSRTRWATRRCSWSLRSRAAMTGEVIHVDGGFHVMGMAALSRRGRAGELARRTSRIALARAFLAAARGPLRLPPARRGGARSRRRRLRLAGAGRAAGRRRSTGVAHAARPTPARSARARRVVTSRWTKGHIEAAGFVDLSLGDDAHPGRPARHVRGDASPTDEQGHRRRRRGQRRLHARRRASRAARRWRWTSTPGTASSTNAVGYVEPGVFVEGRTIERVDDNTYKVEGGTIHLLQPAEPALGLQRVSADARRSTTRSRPRTSVFRVKDDARLLPALLHLPDRGTTSARAGILFPHFG